MKVGTFTLAAENPAVPGCTVSGEVIRDTFVFSMAEGTDISPESYPVRKIWLAAHGAMRILSGREIPLDAGQCYVTPVGTPVGIKADTESVYVEVLLRKETVMNPILDGREVFVLEDLIPYQEGKIVNLDILSSPKLKFVVMSFDEGTGLSEHSAPGEALVFALDGKAIIGYEGKEYPIRAGENFRFEKNGLHYVKADGRFKMALLLVLE